MEYLGESGCVRYCAGFLLTGPCESNVIEFTSMLERERAMSKKTGGAARFLIIKNSDGYRTNRISLAVAFFLVFLLSCSCSQKVVKSGMPFDMDKIAFESVSETDENWREKGVQLARRKEYPEAIEAFSSYIERSPKDSFGYNALAVCYKNIGDPQSAMRNYEKALELSSRGEDRAKVLGNIGNMYFSSGKMQAALGFYKDAAAEFEENPFYVILIARTFVSMNDFDRARKALNQAEPNIGKLEQYERDEDRGLGYYLLAQSYAALNDEGKLMENLDKALKVNASRFLYRVQQDSSDETNLLYTLTDDPKFLGLIRKYSVRVSN